MQHNFSIQDRLAEETTSMAAAEGLTPEQRWLARDQEISATIKSLQEEQKGIRDALKEWYLENAFDHTTGEVKLTDPGLKCGPIQYAPTVKNNWSYVDAEEFVKKLGDKAFPLLDVAAGRVTAALKARTIKESDLEGLRTLNPTISHGTKRVDE